MAFRLKGRFGYPEDEPFGPAFHSDKLRDIQNLGGKGKRVFLDSMSDWFSPGVKKDWIESIVWMAWQKPEHHFLVLTKRPDRMGVLQEMNIGIPDNLWFGVSVTHQGDAWRIAALRKAVDKHRFISFEPLHGPVLPYLEGIEWAIIGMETGNRTNKIVPEKQWINYIVDEAEIWGVPVFLKDNLLPLSGLTAAQLMLAGKKSSLRKEFPEAMR
jgi:protein gp37